MDKALVREWLRFADMDIDTAKAMANHQPCPIEIVCYHAHQFAEKA